MAVPGERSRQVRANELSSRAFIGEPWPINSTGSREFWGWVIASSSGYSLISYLNLKDYSLGAFPKTLVYKKGKAQILLLSCYDYWGGSNAAQINKVEVANDKDAGRNYAKPFGNGSPFQLEGSFVNDPTTKAIIDQWIGSVK